MTIAATKPGAKGVANRRRTGVMFMEVDQWISFFTYS